LELIYKQGLHGTKQIHGFPLKKSKPKQ